MPKVDMSARIMVVDDEAGIRSLLNSILTREGYEVIEVADAEALETSFNGPEPEVILLDLNLPDKGGLELLPTVKKQWPQTEAIVLTGDKTIETAVEATKRGAYAYHTKPFDHKQLLVTIE